MSEKSVRGAGPGVDQAPDPAAPAVPGGGRLPESGGTPVEPWGGERTDRVPGREASGPRVALVPAAPADGRVEGQSSTADTSRMADSGRTTLMGVPSPIVTPSDKPATSPGHDVHLPSEKTRIADNRPIAGSGVEIDPSLTRELGDKSSKAGLSAQDRQPPQGASDRKDGQATREASDRKDSDTGGGAPNERSMAAAAATFRASTPGEGTQPGHDAGHQPERSWTADRTQEFHLDPPPSVRGVFAKTLAAGIAIAAGTGILVVGFIHTRLRAGNADQGEMARSADPLPIAPVPLPPPPLPENPVPPPLAAEPAPPAPPTEAPAEAAPAPAPAVNEAVAEPDDTGKADRRTAPRPRAPAPVGRTAPSARTLRVPAAMARPGVTPPSGPLPSPAALAPGAVPPTTPPPLMAPPPPERPAVKAEQPRPEATKPYDPDMPLPPTME